MCECLCLYKWQQNSTTPPSQPPPPCHTPTPYSLLSRWQKSSSLFIIYRVHTQRNCYVESCFLKKLLSLWQAFHWCQQERTSYWAVLLDSPTVSSPLTRYSSISREGRTAFITLKNSMFCVEGQFPKDPLGGWGWGCWGNLPR